MLSGIWHWLHPDNTPNETKVSGCLMCGDCCKAFGGHLQASTGDLQRWRETAREDILTRVGSNGWLWVVPGTHQIEHQCPFLTPLDDDHYGCSIHETKPEICRSYPTLAHAHRCLHGVFLKLGALIYIASEWCMEIAVLV